VLSLGFNGDVDGVVGRAAVDGECVRGELGLRNGDVRGLLNESGEGL
jgi:hypothetical protein